MNFVDFFYVLKWWVLLFAIGMSFTPLTFRVFPKFLDKGYLFSKVLGITLISYSIYIVSTFHLLKFNTLSIFIIWVLLMGSIWFFFGESTLEIKKNIKIFLLEEIIFFISVLAWSIVRSYQPAIHDLEKFMDFGFINSILRTTYFPPRDMWFTPLSINYYYFGHLITAVLTKLSSIPSYISFNLMLSTIFAFTFSLSFSLGANLVNQVKKISIKKTLFVGLSTAFLISLAGNLQTVYSLFKGYNGESPVPFWKLALSLPTFPNSYWYPNATRFIFHTIHEFPSYSFVVADLHGHVLDIPIVICLIAIFSHLLISRKIEKISLVLIALLLAASYMTNAWDGLIYLGLSEICIFSVLFIRNSDRKIDRRAIESLFDSIRHFVPIVVLFFVFSFVFNKNFSPFASGIGLNCSPDFLVKIGKIGPFIFEKGQCAHSPLWQLGILYGFFVFMLFSFLIFMRKRKFLISDYIVVIFSLFSIVLIIIPEFFYLKDIYTGYFRANTMFKLAYQAFIMFSLSSAYILFRIVLNIKEFKNRFARLGFYVFLFSFLALFSFVSIYPYFSIPSGYGDLKNYQGLDGVQYLKIIKPYDYQAINWINENISGQPVILEAQGDSYTDFARISANTGLPTVLGWTVHEWLWRGSYDIPAARFEDIKRLYESPSLEETKKIIKRYNISYVYIGGLEKEKYAVNEEKFREIGKLVYENAGSEIFKLN